MNVRRKRIEYSATETERKVLEALWAVPEQGASIRHIAAGIYGEDHGTGQYATVQKLLDRLEKKGMVEKRRDGKVNIYAACVDRSEYVGRQLEGLADNFCGGSVMPLITNLVGSSRLSDSDLQSLRDLVDRKGK